MLIDVPVTIGRTIPRSCHTKAAQQEYSVTDIITNVILSYMITHVVSRLHGRRTQVQP